jgi:hypothetical protein
MDAYQFGSALKYSNLRSFTIRVAPFYRVETFLGPVPCHSPQSSTNASSRVVLKSLGRCVKRPQVRSRHIVPVETAVVLCCLGSSQFHISEDGQAVRLRASPQWRNVVPSHHLICVHCPADIHSVLSDQESWMG